MLARMPLDVIVHRTGFTVLQAGATAPEEVSLDPRFQAPIMVAVLDTRPDSSRTASVAEIGRSPLFEHITTEDGVRKAIKSAAELLKSIKLGGRTDALQITWGAGSSRGKARLVVGEDVTIQLSRELAELLDIQRGRARSDQFPPHNREQLRIFANVIQNAADQFNAGRAKTARNELRESLKRLAEPRYRAVVMLRMARASLRLGDEPSAARHIQSAVHLVEGMPQADPILIARAKYNSAWLEYTKGNFSYQSIREAADALAGAGPDDLRLAYVATLHGLVVVKDIEQHVRSFSQDELDTKGREALAYLTHAIYLFIRSEDFWGAQEACCNLAHALYRIGNISRSVSDKTGLIGRDAEEILNWISASNEIAGKHSTGTDSVRNHVLRASILMTRRDDLDEAAKALEMARALVETKKPVGDDRSVGEDGVTISPRERGRLYERLLYYNLARATSDVEGREQYEKEALRVYKLAERAWSAKGLELLLENELHRRYEKQGSRIIRKHRRGTRADKPY